MSLKIKVNESVMSPKAALQELKSTDAGAIYRILKSYNTSAANEYLDGLEMLKDDAISGVLEESKDEMARPIGTKFNDDDELYIHPIGTSTYIKAYYARNIKGLDYFVCEQYDESVSYDASRRVDIEICDLNYEPQGVYRYELVDSELRPKFFDITSRQMDALENVAAQFKSRTRPYYIVGRAYKYEAPAMGTVELNGKTYNTITRGGLQWLADAVKDYFGTPNGVYQYSRPDIKKFIVPALKGIGYRLPTRADLKKLMGDPRSKDMFVNMIPRKDVPFQYIVSSEEDGTILEIDGRSRIIDGLDIKSKNWDPQELFIVVPCKDID